jgi:hypothetical protein
MMVTEMDVLECRRRAQWGQTPETRCADEAAAESLIQRAGIVTHYPVTPELPNLLHAHTGSPTTKATSEHDGDSGHVYTWRWTLGRREAGFYTAIVLKRPTWVAWNLLPAVLRLRGDLRAIDEIFDTGTLSADAYRVARALEEAGEPLATGDLRRVAGFPIGKVERAAYLKAVAELDTRLLVAKVFSPTDEDMRHTLVRHQYPEAVGAAERLSSGEAMRQLLTAYLPSAVYALPDVLVKSLAVPTAALLGGLEALCADGLAKIVTTDGQAQPVYLWNTVA